MSVVRMVAMVTACLVVSGAAVAAPDDSRLRKAALGQPTAERTGTVVTVSGRVWKKRGRARLERLAGHHWHLVRTVTIRRHHFSAKVAQRTSVAKYRVRAGKRHSRVFVVRVRVHRPTAPVAHGPAERPPAIAGVVNLVNGVVGGVVGAVTGPKQPAPPASTPSTSTDACGPRPSKPDGSLWSCTFHDEFSGTALDRTRWMPQTNFTSGTPAAEPCYLDDADNIAVRDGTLRLTIRNEVAPVRCRANGRTIETPYTAGSVMTYHLFSQQYGRFEARMASPATSGPGLQETFWLWPDDRVPSTDVWPTAGEIDISELYSIYPTLSIPFIHSRKDSLGAVPTVNTSWTCTATRGEFHTYTLEWTPDRLRILVDGRQCLSTSGTDAAFQKPYIIALSALLGVGTNALSSSASLPATTRVDYVRVWR